MSTNYIRLLSVLSILCCCSFLSAFGGRAADKDPSENKERVTIVGHINVYGSMPHTYLGIVADDKKEYTILAEKDILSQLQKTQGQIIAFTGVVIPRDDENGTKMLFQTLKDGKFELVSWQIIKK